jgi:hypothetical protein
MAEAAEQLICERKSYDPMASVRMLRFDIENFEDGTQPETRERVGEEELSYIAEGIDKASCTKFVLKREKGEVVYFREGEWRNYKGLLMTGLETARAEAKNDPRRQFLVGGASEDLVNGNIMSGLRPGEQHTWWSSYEHDIEERYGAPFMEQCGRQPERKMGLLYRAYCQEDGSILLESQTVDRSDPDSFNAIAIAVESNPNIDMGSLVDIYDSVIYEKEGVACFAGRTESERAENAWDEIHKHRDLIEYHLNTLEEIASRSATDEELERATKKHTYGVWAAFKKRIEGEAMSHTVPDRVYVSHQIDAHLHQLLEQETKSAFQDFAQKGVVMIGCGGGFAVVSGEEATMRASAGEVHTSIFGGDKHGSLTFTCPNGHHNRRKYGELLESCKREGCKAKVACK